MYNTLINVGELCSLPESIDVVNLDVRFYLGDTDKGRQEYAKAHVAGAHYAHLDQDLCGPILPGKTGRHPLPDPILFMDLVGSWGIEKESQVIIYDQGHGGLAARLWWMFQWIGHPHASVVQGGWPEIERSKIPIDSNQPSIREGRSYPGSIQEDMVWSLRELEDAMKANSVVLIDARDGARYRGEVEPIDPVAGHIPGALSYPFKDNLADGSLWKDKTELRKRFEDLATIPSDQIALYCGSGVTACHNILAMQHAGYEIPKLYPGSWSEWIVHHELDES